MARNILYRYAAAVTSSSSLTMSDPPDEGKTSEENKSSQFLDRAVAPPPGNCECGAGDHGATYDSDKTETRANSETLQVLTRDGEKSKQKAAFDELSLEQLDKVGGPLHGGGDGVSDSQGKSNDRTGDDYHKPPEERIHQPNSFDVLLGRGRPFQNHRGNQAMLR